MPAGVIKQTHEDMLHLAQQGQSHCDDFLASTQQLVTHANELATSTMQGAAGAAVLQKTSELQATSDRMAHTASEKYQGIGQFAQAGMNSAHEAASRITAIAGA
ncbi:MAG: hypothetical protein PHQ28_05020 [Mycobacterium sp.]|nr:hypothetical protein [Mycobacterium sp.]